MKYCEEYAALLDLFVDGELTPEEMARVQAHLEGCPGCRAYVDDALAMRAGFPEIEDTSVPEGFAEGVMERVRQDAEKGAKVVELRRRSLRRWMGTAAALAACCALVVFVRTGSGGLRGGSDTAVTAAGGYSAPAACDTSADSESGIAAQAAEAPEAKEAGEAAPEDGREEPGGQIGARMAPMEQEDRDAGVPENTSGNGDLPLLVSPAAAPEAADTDAGAREAALYLTADEAGDLLDAFSVVWENAVEWRYELNKEEYRALLEALGRSEELPEAAEGPFLVVVTGPFE